MQHTLSLSKISHSCASHNCFLPLVGLSSPLPPPPPPLVVTTTSLAPLPPVLTTSSEETEAEAAEAEATAAASRIAAATEDGRDNITVMVGNERFSRGEPLPRTEGERGEEKRGG